VRLHCANHDAVVFGSTAKGNTLAPDFGLSFENESRKREDKEENSEAEPPRDQLHKSEEKHSPEKAQHILNLPNVFESVYLN